MLIYSLCAFWASLIHFTNIIIDFILKATLGLQKSFTENTENLPRSLIPGTLFHLVTACVVVIRLLQLMNQHQLGSTLHLSIPTPLLNP